jgi:hypothetical protein
MALVLVQASPQSQQEPRPAPPATTRAAAPAAGTLPGNLEHGRYLVESVAMCIECHSGRDDQGNILSSRLFLGGPIPFAPPWPNDWAMRAPRNRGLPGYTDALALRLLTQGAIGRDGQQLRRPMPRFHMTVQDATDVITYLRSLS